MHEEVLSKILKKSNLSQTKIRKKILTCFLKNKRPLSILDFKKEDFFLSLMSLAFIET